MIEVIITAANFLLLIITWEFFAKKTILDYHRDKLFDLRQEIRGEFLKRDELGSVAYRELRELVNSQIMLTENLSFLQYVLWDRELNRNKAIKTQIEEINQKRFSTNDEELNKLIDEYRTRSTTICISYTVFSSLVLTIFFMFISLVVLNCLLIKAMVSDFTQFFANRKKIWALSLSLALSKMKFFDRKTFEDASYLMR